MPSKADLKALKKQAHSLKPLVIIGKEGLKDTALDEIRTHLKKRKLIKVKLNRASVDLFPIESIAESICSETNATLVEIKGFVMTLHRS